MKRLPWISQLLQGLRSLFFAVVAQSFKYFQPIGNIVVVLYRRDMVRSLCIFQVTFSLLEAERAIDHSDLRMLFPLQAHER